MKHIVFTGLFMLLFACGSSDSNSEESSEEQNINDHLTEEVDPIVEESKLNVSEFILGDWIKIAQNCDENGENCEDVGGSDWKFDSTQIYLGRVSQPYEVINDTIYVNGSPYFIEKIWGDTILFHGIKTARYLKLVKQ